MKSANIHVLVVTACLIFATAVQAQEVSSQTAAAAQASSQTIVPPLVKFSGTLLDAQNRPLAAGLVGLTFALYAQQTGGAALWMETQNVRPDENGNYTVLLGAETASGVPMDLFASGEARWLGVQIERQPEQPRVLLVSVPYALKAGDAATVGGLPPSAFALANSVEAGTTKSGDSTAVSTATPNAAKPSNGANPAVTGKGTVDFIPMFDAASDIIDSVMFQMGSEIGIGTTTPTATLDVNGTVRVRKHAIFAADNAGNSIAITQNNTSGLGLTSTSPVQALVGNATGFLDGGIGVQGNATYTGSGTTYGVQGSAASTSGIGVQGGVGTPGGIGVQGDNSSATSGIGVEGTASGSGGIGVQGQANSASGTGVVGQSSSSTGIGMLGNALSTTGSTVGIKGIAASPSGIGIQAFSANIGIEGNGGGTFPIGVHGVIDSGVGAAGVFDNPAFILAPFPHCSGNVLIGRAESGTVLSRSLSNVFRVDCTGKGFFDGGTVTGGADFAESVTVRGDRTQYEPGDLLVIDSRSKGRLALSQQTYSTRVAGIYSTKPGVLATPHRMDDPQLAQEVPLAVVGIVPCKVTAENGPIEVGDLLVSSSKAGYAMKGTDRRRMLGAVVGKAMEPLQSNTGVIEVLVTLQ